MLYKAHLKFLLSARMSLRFIKENLEPIYDTFRSFEYYDAQYELYMHTIQTQWDYEQQRAYDQQIAQASNGYRSAYAVCMSSRDYTVK